MDIITNFLAFADQLPSWLNALLVVVGSATAITILTPTKTDDKIVDSVLGVLNFLAGNFAKNKNADDVEK